MSVTHEALEKAAREKERHAPPPPPLAPAPVAAPPVRPKRKPTRWIVRGVSVAALIVVGLFLWRAAGTFRQVEQVLQPPPPPPVPVVAPPKPPPEPVVESRYKVTGIMGLPGQYSATVNGQLVTEAQYVDGAIVKRIERDRVVLDVNGRELVVRYF
jgi:hypothetical protein